MKSKLILSFLLFCNILFVNNSFAQKRTEVGGTKVSLVPPTIMQAATKYYGFQNDSILASIMIMEVALKMQEIVKDFADKKKVKEKGMTVISNKTVTISGKKFALIKMKQTAADVNFMRTILFYDNDSTTIMINGACPEAQTALVAEIEKAVLSTEISKMDYAIDVKKTRIDVEGTIFKDIERPLGPSMTMFSVDKVRPSKNPYIILYEVGSVTEVEDQATQCEKKMKSRNWRKELSEISTRPLEIKGFKAYETTAKAKNEDGTTELLYLVMYFSDKETVSLDGGATSDFEANLAIFRKIALTFK
jgi:hypothetical protein